MQTAAEAKVATHIYVVASTAFEAQTESHRLEVADADDVGAGGVGGGVGFGRGPDGVVEDLDDRFWGFVVPGGEIAEAGAAAVDAEFGVGGVGDGG